MRADLVKDLKALIDADPYGYESLGQTRARLLAAGWNEKADIIVALDIAEGVDLAQSAWPRHVLWASSEVV